MSQLMRRHLGILDVISIFIRSGRFPKERPLVDLRSGIVRVDKPEKSRIHHNPTVYCHGFYFALVIFPERLTAILLIMLLSY